VAWFYIAIRSSDGLSIMFNMKSAYTSKGYPIALNVLRKHSKVKLHCLEFDCIKRYLILIQNLKHWRLNIKNSP